MSDLKPPTDEQKQAYKVAFKAYLLSGRELLAARADWLPEPPRNPVEDLKVDSQYMANARVQQALIDEVNAELAAERAAAGG